MEKNRIVLWLLASIVLLAIFGAFAKIMSGFNHNEHMYIAASVLVAQNQLPYKDFAYLQTPYLPLLYGNLYRLLGVGAYYLLIGKLISFIFLSMTSIILFFLGLRVLHDVALALGVVALFLLNMTIVSPATEVSNYIMPVAFSMMSIYVFHISVIENRLRPFGAALAGILLAIAIGTRLTYATVVIPFAVVILLYPAIGERSAGTLKDSVAYVLFPFVSGIAVGLLPTLFFMSDLEALVFNNLGYHNVNSHWRQITGHSGPISLYAKVAHAHEIYFQADNLILMLGVLLGFGFSISNSQTLKQSMKQVHAGAFLATLLVLLAVLTALVPTPSWPAYFAMPVSFLFLLLIHSCASETVEIANLHRRLLLILVFLSSIYNGPALLKAGLSLMHRDGWTGLHVHDVSTGIRNVLADYGMDTDGKIATLSPLFVIESNLPIYAELSTGPFLYRVGDLLTPEQRNHFVGTSAKSIGDLFAKDPPAGIIVGFEGTLEKALLEYAISNNYSRTDVAGFGGELYVRP
jgi:hypothetical protein